MNRLFFANLIPGTVLYNRFRLLRCLSASDMCGVYLCMALDELETLYALKIFRNDKRVSRKGKEALIKEYSLSSEVKHENVLSSSQLYESEDFVAFSMPYLPGGSLADLLDVKRVWRSREVINILHQISEGLTALHEAGIVHRDLKPENILLDDHDNAVIADFGIGAQISDCDDTAEACLIGTPEYWAPEYVITGRSDVRGDIYALGVIGHELLTGELPPYAEISIGGLVIHVRKPVSVFLPENYPSLLTKIIYKCLEEDPEKRFQTAAELRAMLRTLKAWEDLADVEEQASGFIYRTDFIERITGNSVPLRSSRRTIRIPCAAISHAVTVEHQWQNHWTSMTSR